jgi:hypothetical protein
MASSERRNRNRTITIRPIELRLSYTDAAGVQQVVQAYIVDVSDDGLGLQLRSELPVETVVGLIPSAAAEGLHLPAKGSVRWTRAMAGGLFRAGLRYEAVPAGRKETLPDMDLYEVMEVSPKASPETIHRVYRLLAQQLHPDNKQSGDSEAFRRLVTAYQLLSDPARRAAYDLERGGALRARWRPFLSPESTRGTEAERRRRYGLLRGLYAKRMLEPREPGMTIFDLEELLGVPRDHLEFTLWYLKERGFVSRSDNNRFQITVTGVDQAESLEQEQNQTTGQVPRALIGGD